MCCKCHSDPFSSAIQVGGQTGGPHNMPPLAQGGSEPSKRLSEPDANF
jgi:hypothetical protein